MGYRTIIARYVAKRGIARMCLCKIKYLGGYRTILGECSPPLKKSRDVGITAIALQYRAIWGHKVRGTRQQHFNCTSGGTPAATGVDAGAGAISVAASS